MADEYSFLQETIKNEAGNKNVRRKKILKLIGCAFLFGIVASFAFFASKPWMDDMFEGNPEKVTIPEDEVQKDEAEPEAVPQVVENEDAYRKMLNELNGISRVANRSMTSVAYAQSTQPVTGMIVADNGQELLIFGAILPDEKSGDIVVTFCDSKSYTATVKKQDETLGFAVYAVEKDTISEETWGQIKTADLGNSNLVKTGDTMIIFGKSLEGTEVVSYGFAASTEERKEIVDGNLRLIRTDVGGTDMKDGFMIDMNGNVVGAIHALGEENPNKMLVTAYSISDIKKEIERLSNAYAIPYFGIYGVAVTEEMAELSEQGITQGIYVKDIVADSPAMSAGIQMGDIITKVGETDVTNLQEYRSAMLQYYAGQQVVIQGSRRGANNEYVEIEFKLVVSTKE